MEKIRGTNPGNRLVPAKRMKQDLFEKAGVEGAPGCVPPFQEGLDQQGRVGVNA